MKAYVELIQRKERELGTDMLTHQKVRIPRDKDRGWLTIACSGAVQTTSTTS
jgi:isocitrate lyase